MMQGLMKGRDSEKGCCVGLDTLYTLVLQDARLCKVYIGDHNQKGLREPEIYRLGRFLPLVRVKFRKRLISEVVLR